jgi:hypothetical protein
MARGPEGYLDRLGGSPRHWHDAGVRALGGLARALYIDAYIQGEVRVPLPGFFRALGFEQAKIDPSQVPEVAPGHEDGGLLYYNDITLERGGWYVRATGFYPVEKGGPAAATVDLSRLLVRSLTIRHEARG